MAARAKQTRPKAVAPGTKRVSGQAARAKKKAAPKTQRKDSVGLSEADLETKCMRLESELATANERIAELEQLNEQAINRIDWVIDSLQTLMVSQAKK